MIVIIPSLRRGKTALLNRKAFRAIAEGRASRSIRPVRAGGTSPTVGEIRPSEDLDPVHADAVGTSEGRD
jgi:hypothetical protein